MEDLKFHHPCSGIRLLPLERLGVREVEPGILQFGAVFPGISASRGFRVFVRIADSEDLQASPREFELEHGELPLYGDYWSIEVSLRDVPRGDARGKPPSFFYSHHITAPNGYVADAVSDPFASECGSTGVSSFQPGEGRCCWSQFESRWRTPRLSDLILYEVMVPTFGGNFAGTMRHLDYLAELGVNAIELGPITRSACLGDYLPLSHFAVDGRIGRARDVHTLVDAAHQRGMAVILDVVYSHTGSDFPYLAAYRKLGLSENPMMGPFARDEFGESTDFRKEFTRAYFLTANAFWLSEYHIDGFRYDHVPGYWDGPVGEGFASLAYHTYRFVGCRLKEGGFWERFRDERGNRLIQCAEDLVHPEHVLATSYANCCWQTRTVDAARRVARGDLEAITDLGLRLGAWGFPTLARSNGDDLPKAVVQYLENHDHDRFIRQMGMQVPAEDSSIGSARVQWLKLRPYLIALFTAKGLPMLWQGQEFAADNAVNELAERESVPLHTLDWTLASDDCGESLRRLVKELIRLRKRRAEFRDGDHYFHDQGRSQGLLLFCRYDEIRFSLIALNFSGVDREVAYFFPRPGDYCEELQGQGDRLCLTCAQERLIRVPAHDGCIWAMIRAEI